MFKSKVKQLLLQRSLDVEDRVTQRELARATRLNEMTISKWVADEGMARIDAKSAAALCRYFNCELNDLVTLEMDDEARPEKITHPDDEQVAEAA